MVLPGARAGNGTFSPPEVLESLRTAWELTRPVLVSIRVMVAIGGAWPSSARESRGWSMLRLPRLKRPRKRFRCVSVLLTEPRCGPPSLSAALWLLAPPKLCVVDLRRIPLIVFPSRELDLPLPSRSLDSEIRRSSSTLLDSWIMFRYWEGVAVFVDVGQLFTGTDILHS